MLQQPLIDEIRSSEFFSILSDEDIQKLLPSVEQIHLNAEDILFHQGDEPDFVYIVTSGELLAYLKKNTNEILVVNMINIHESVGELGALSGEPRTLTVKALVNTNLLRIPSSIFKALMIHNPELSTIIYRLIIRRSTQTISLIDKKVHHVSIVFNIIQNISPIKLKSYFLEYLEPYKEDHKIIVAEDHTLEEIINIVEEAEIKNKFVIIQMNKWDEALYKPLRNKLSHFYLLVNEGEKTYKDIGVQEIINTVKQVPNIRLELILLHAETRFITNTQRYFATVHFSMHHHVRLNRTTDFERLARFMTGNATALVLGGGGAKGVVHIGAIQAILENNIPIDAIGGTSIGAYIGASYALTENLNQALIYTRKLRNASMRSLKWRNFAWPLVSIFTGNPVTSFLKDTFQNFHIEDLPINYFAISSNYDKRIEKIHRTGLLWQATRATASIPGIVPPLVLHGEVLFDGGLLNNLPVDRMREMIGERHKIIASSITNTHGTNISYHFPPALSLKDSFLVRFKLSKKRYIYPPLLPTFMESMLLGASAREEHNRLMADIHIRPNLFGYKTFVAHERDEQVLLKLGHDEMVMALAKQLKKQAEAEAEAEKKAK